MEDCRASQNQDALARQSFTVYYPNKIAFCLHAVNNSRRFPALSIFEQHKCEFLRVFRLIFLVFEDLQSVNNVNLL